MNSLRGEKKKLAEDQEEFKDTLKKLQVKNDDIIKLLNTKNASLEKNYQELSMANQILESENSQLKSKVEELKGNLNQIENNYQEVVRVFSSKEKGITNEKNTFKKLFKDKEKENYSMKVSLQSQISFLKLQNKEYQSRIKNLIENFIVLKGYAEEIERRISKETEEMLKNVEEKSQEMGSKLTQCNSCHVIDSIKDLMLKIDSKIAQSTFSEM